MVILVPYLIRAKLCNALKVTALDGVVVAMSGDITRPRDGQTGLDDKQVNTRWADNPNTL